MCATLLLSASPHTYLNPCRSLRGRLVWSWPPSQPHLHRSFPSLTMFQSHWSSGYSKIMSNSSPAQGLGIPSLWKALPQASHSHPLGLRLGVKEVFPDCYSRWGLLDTPPHRILFTSQPYCIYHIPSPFCLLIVSSLRAGILSVLFTAASLAPNMRSGMSEVFNDYFLCSGLT